ncbi:3-ketoacyl-CoA synthase 4 [Monoraphidium neglectum]|uniref:3-ketoacyl-CoA synthase n=1 Tax=Monoraphidium neglectum TaxID=145388 RepID=A0A0D2MVW0_9CHLO|nr:3-ketoacyl-CoA synthase 4 [Monoraphidium neglectum]KIZ06635.1 3-ketoacyl-CoA synthase 4 [Monoraphidium neglectum]|eukprot:XP_013905654.1 3-ketoacyl-CoA synthase 4 [Monoraphidium neglectum]
MASAPALAVRLWVCGAALLLSAALLWRTFSRRRTYLVDYSVYRSPDSWKVSKKEYDAIVASTNNFSPESLQFMSKVLARSGLGDETYAPPSLTNVPMSLNMAACRFEFESVAFGAVKDLLNKVNVSPKQIGVVITNSSLFNTTPSLSATIMNHFGMGSNTINYNLGGMGCSAGVIAADLARQMLEIYPNTYALVVSTENLTYNWYPGTNRGMLVTNTIFRVGGAALLLSNKRQDSWRSKYELQHVVRTNLAANDAAFNCVFEVEDEAGVRGIRLGKELMGVAGQALKKNITTLGPKVLPLSEQLLFAANMLARKVYGSKRVKAYVPNFKKAFNHICIHTGGRAVIDEIEKQLTLGRETVEPSRASLFRFGNVSSSSIWYCLAYIESYRGLKRGDTVWQLGFGSGFKCNSAVWRANRRIRDSHSAWEGFDVEHMYEQLAKMP